MSAITSAVSAYPVTTRYVSASDRNANSSPAPAAPVPQREADLNQELDKRLSGQITRIRRQINSSASDTGAQPQGLGRNLDIRA